MNALERGIRYDERGLAPCVVQDCSTGEVLMLAYVNAEALERSRATGEMHFFSRSRGELWHKGETSGNVQRLRGLRYDCDCDAVLALVEPAGPACHTGERSCFYREVGGAADPVQDGPGVAGEPVPAPFEALGALERVIADRDRERPTGAAPRRPSLRSGPSRREGSGGGRGGLCTSRWESRSKARGGGCRR